MPYLLSYTCEQQGILEQSTKAYKTPGCQSKQSPTYLTLSGTNSSSS